MSVQRRRPTRRRPARRGHGRGGFWAEFRRTTHTDRFRHRVGGVAGRAVIRGVNRSRRRRGKDPLPVVGDWFGGKSHTTRGRRSGTTRRPSQRGEPAFSGRHVKATNTRRKAPLFGTSVSSTGLSGPGNRGAGNGMGAPVYGAGGAHGDDGHMVSHGSAQGSAMGAPEKRTTGAAGRPDPFTSPVSGLPIITPGAALLAAAVETGKGLLGMPDPHQTGSTHMSQPTSDQLTEAPNTDAEHLQNINGLAEEIQGFADKLSEYVEACRIMGMDDAALASADQCVEALGEAATAAGQMATDYETTYEGVRETAANGTKIPGTNGQPATFWDDVAS